MSQKKTKFKEIFWKLRILKFAPKEDWEWNIFYDEFKDCDFNVLTKVADIIIKNYDEFPRPATIWKIYNTLIKPITHYYHCQNCNKVYEVKNNLNNELTCPKCQTKLEKI